MIITTELVQSFAVGDVVVEHLVDHWDGGVSDRYRVKTVGGLHVEVLPQLVNWRIHTVAVDAIPGVSWSDRFWCYAGRRQATFVAAVLAAAAWDGADNTEPVGWVRSWDGRRNGEGPCRTRIAGVGT